MKQREEREKEREREREKEILDKCTSLDDSLQYIMLNQIACVCKINFGISIDMHFEIQFIRQVLVKILKNLIPYFDSE